MSKRITFMLDDDVGKKLRVIQAKEISGSTESVSFSKIINDTLRKGLR